MKLLFFLLLLSSMAFGQGVFAPPQQALKIVNGITSPLASATITVCAANVSGIPCAPALVGATFKDSALTQPLSNPFTADANGNYQFAIAQGQYTITVSGLGFSGYSYQASVNCPLSAACTWTQTQTFATLAATTLTATTLTATQATVTNGTSSQSVTLAPLTAAGSTSTTVCASGWTCTPDYGQITLAVSGSGIASGDQISITWGTAGDHIRVCTVNAFDSTAGATIATVIQDTSSGINSTTKSVLFSSTALTTAHSYSWMYVCH